MFHLTVIQRLILAVAAFGVGISKTGIAGLGIVAVAVFALVLPAKASVGVVLPVLIMGDICAISMYRRKVVWRHILRLFPWAGVGVVIGYFALGHMDSEIAGKLIGGILIVLTGVQIARRRQARQTPGSDGVAHGGVMQSRMTVAVMGLLAGFTTMVANAAGPIMVLYLLSTRLPKIEFIGTGAWYFFLMNLFKVPFSVELGLINRQSLPVDAALAPLVVAGAFYGRRIVTKIDQGLFELIAIALTLAAAVRLVW